MFEPAGIADPAGSGYGRERKEGGQFENERQIFLFADTPAGGYDYRGVGKIAFWCRCFPGFHYAYASLFAGSLSDFNPAGSGGVCDRRLEKSRGNRQNSGFGFRTDIRQNLSVVKSPGKQEAPPIFIDRFYARDAGCAQSMGQTRSKIHSGGGVGDADVGGIQLREQRCQDVFIKIAVITGEVRFMDGHNIQPGFCRNEMGHVFRVISQDDDPNRHWYRFPEFKGKSDEFIGCRPEFSLQVFCYNDNGSCHRASFKPEKTFL